jgi:hypothetical protein
MKKLFISIILILSLCFSSTVISAEPVIEDVIIDPIEPKVMDTITITATVTSDEEIDSITIRIKECDETLCMQTESYEMDLVDGKYIITDELTYAKATYFSYQFIITSNGNESETEFFNVTLQPDTSGETNGDNGESDSGIPIYIFIIIIAVIIIAIIIVVIRKK